MAEKRKIPVNEDLFTSPFSPLEEVRLRGVKCNACGEAQLGKRRACQNCGSRALSEIVFSKRGKLYSYTILRNRPPGDYKGPEHYVPFAVGLIELPEGVRIMAPLTDRDFDSIKIGGEVEFVPTKLYEDAEGNEVYAHAFHTIG